MKLTLVDGTIVETRDPMQENAIREMQNALIGFMEACGDVPADDTDPDWERLVEEARASGRGCLRASEVVRSVLVMLGVSEPAAEEFLARSTRNVRAFLEADEAG